MGRNRFGALTAIVDVQEQEEELTSNEIGRVQRDNQTRKDKGIVRDPVQFENRHGKKFSGVNSIPTKSKSNNSTSKTDFRGKAGFHVASARLGENGLKGPIIEAARAEQASHKASDISVSHVTKVGDTCFMEEVHSSALEDSGGGNGIPSSSNFSPECLAPKPPDPLPVVNIFCDEAVEN